MMMMTMMNLLMMATVIEGVETHELHTGLREHGVSLRASS